MRAARMESGVSSASRRTTRTKLAIHQSSAMVTNRKVVVGCGSNSQLPILGNSSCFPGGRRIAPVRVNRQARGPVRDLPRRDPARPRRERLRGLGNRFQLDGKGVQLPPPGAERLRPAASDSTLCRFMLNPRSRRFAHPLPRTDCKTALGGWFRSIGKPYRETAPPIRSCSRGTASGVILKGKTSERGGSSRLLCRKGSRKEPKE